MKRNSLGWWLAASNVAIVLLVAAGISYFAIDMLRDLADSQQKVRVQLAGANSRAEITRMAEDTLTHARVLAAAAKGKVLRPRFFAPSARPPYQGGLCCSAFAEQPHDSAWGEIAGPGLITSNPRRLRRAPIRLRHLPPLRRGRECRTGGSRPARLL